MRVEIKCRSANLGHFFPFFVRQLLSDNLHVEVNAVKQILDTFFLFLCNSHCCVANFGHFSPRFSMTTSNSNFDDWYANLLLSSVPRSKFKILNYRKIILDTLLFYKVIPLLTINFHLQTNSRTKLCQFARSLWLIQKSIKHGRFCYHSTWW